MLLQETCEYRWHNSTKKHFEDFGYRFTFRGDIFYPNVRHLPKTSTQKIKMSCDGCSIKKDIDVGIYRRSLAFKEGGFGAYYCSSCATKVYRTLSNSDFSNIVLELTNSEYMLSGEYKNSGEKVEITHKTCGNTYPVRPRDFIHQESRCPYCNGKFKKTTLQYKDEIHNLVGDEYSVLGEYVNSATKIKKKHMICGEEYFVTPNDFLSGCRCSKCMGKKKISSQEFLNEVYNLVQDEYVVLGEFVNKKVKIEMKHSVCNFTYEVLPYHFLNGVRCPKCNGRMRKTTEEYISEVKNIIGDEYIVIGKYKNSSTKIAMMHTTCGSKWNVVPNAFLQGSRCPKCNQSKGEKKIVDYLISNNKSFVEQYKFKDCRNKYPLPFDVAVLDENEKVNFLIEFDGIQHFYPLDFFGGQKGFNEIKRNDNIKNAYCLKNNIALLRISYMEIDNINIILESYFK